MMLFIFVSTLVIIGVLESLSRYDNLRRVKVSFKTDMDMVEPGETFTLHFTVANQSAFPVLYVGFGLSFDDLYAVCEEEDWKSRHLTESIYGSTVSYRFFLLPHKQFSGKVHLSMKKRGIYDLGRSYVEKSDLLGLFPTLRSNDIGIKLICTAKTTEITEPSTVGGFLGQTSVRRFIHEDPSMMIGYNDYTGREPMKQISWFQTAKRGELTVRQYDHTVDYNVSLVVNMESDNPLVKEECLSITRTVCEYLEGKKIPYAFYSNGDLFSVREGLGRSHLMPILRRIGLSQMACYRSLSSLVDKCILGRKGADSYIVISPVLDDAGTRELDRLQAVSDTKLCILYGEVKSA